MADTRILIVEDEGIEALDLQHRLTSLGYAAPDIVATGEEAVIKAEETRPDLILMDIMLRGEMDGVTAAGRIHARFDIPVIFITAYADEDTLRRAKTTEPYGYLVKPFKEKDLHISIDMALYKHTMEKKVKESEKWLGTTLSSIGDAVIATDKNGLITFMNPVAEELMGWKLDEVKKKNLMEVFHILNKDTRKPVENPVTRVLREGTIVGLANHTVLISRSGKEIPINDSAAPIKDDKGNILGVILVFSDMTEREKAEEALREAYERKHAQEALRKANEILELRVAERAAALRESEERLRLAVTATDLGTWDYNPVTGALTWDARCKELFGLPPEETVNYDTFLAGLHPDDRDRTHQVVQRTFDPAAGGKYDIEYRTVGIKDGGVTRWIRATGRAFFNDQGQADRFTGTVQDITGRKKAEEEIKRHNAVLNGINTVFKEALMSRTDEELAGACLRVAEGITGSKFGFIGEIGPDGLLHDTAISDPGWELCTMEDKTGHRRPPGNFKLDGIYGRVLLDGKSFYTNDPASHPDSIGTPKGHPPLTAFLGAPLVHGGRTFGMIAVGNREGGYRREEQESLEALAPAIVEALYRTRAEEALRAAHTELERRAYELEAVNRELESFSYTVSHDLKAPLRSIEGFAKAILEDYAEQLDETGRDYLMRVHSASQRMTHLIEAMLNMARLTRGAIQERTVDLSSLAQVIAHEIRKQAPERQVEFIIRKNVKAKGDQDMLQVMLENLLDNAWKFTSKHLAAKIEFGTTNMDGKTVYFVRDDGAGFNTDFSDKLFKPFKRLHAESEFPGIGIGLAIAHRIIMRHNGRLWAESAPEKGATFFFTLA